MTVSANCCQFRQAAGIKTRDCPLLSSPAEYPSNLIRKVMMPKSVTIPDDDFQCLVDWTIEQWYLDRSPLGELVCVALLPWDTAVTCFCYHEVNQSSLILDPDVCLWAVIPVILFAFCLLVILTYPVLTVPGGSKRAGSVTFSQSWINYSPQKSNFHSFSCIFGLHLL